MKRLLAHILCILPCFSQATISSVNRYAYSANAGWIDFHANGTDGVVVSETYLAGKAYAANFGWIDLGDGTPDNGHSYSNATATDCGVNLSNTGALTGFAYAANVGWIQFEQTHGKPTFDFPSGHFSGYAYSANVGWIALHTRSSNLFTTTIQCPDLDRDGIGDSYEMFHFSTLTKIDDLSDYDLDGYSDVEEYLANTDPINSNDYLKIIEQTYDFSSTSVTLLFTSKQNRVYRIEHNTDLGLVWQNSNLGTFAPSTGPTTLSKSVNFAVGPRRFFRVVALKPLQP